MLNLTPLAKGYLEATDGTIDHRSGRYYIDFFGDDSLELGATEEEAQTTLNRFMRENLPSFLEDWYGLDTLEYVTDEGIRPYLYTWWCDLEEKPIPLMPLVIVADEVLTFFEALDRFGLDELDRMIYEGAAHIEALAECVRLFPSEASKILEKSGL